MEHLNYRERSNQIRQMIVIRWIVLFSLFSCALILWVFSPFPFVSSVLPLACVGAYNGVSHLILKWGEKGKPVRPELLQVLSSLTIFLDVAVLGARTYFTGGAASHLISFYLVYILLIVLVLSPRETIAATVLTVVALNSALWLELDFPGSLPVILKTSVYQTCYILLTALISLKIVTGYRNTLARTKDLQEQTETLRQLALSLNSPKSMNQILTLVLDASYRLLLFDCAVILILDEHHQVKALSSLGLPDNAGENITLFTSNPEFEKLMHLNQKSSRPFPAPAFPWDLFDRSGINDSIAMPLMAHNQNIGFFLIGYQKTRSGPWNETLLNNLCCHTVLAVENALLYEKIHLEARTDGLTKINNQRYFWEILALEFKRSQCYNASLSLLMLDLDRFKQVNDRYGHLVGDRVLQEFAEELKLNSRATDLVFRYGGEEFMMILPETNTVQASDVAERLRRAVENHPFPIGSHSDIIHITTSIGIAVYPQDAKKLRYLVRAADIALMEAKSKRNSVVRFWDVPEAKKNYRYLN